MIQAVTAEEKNDGWHKLIALKNQSFSTKLSSSLKDDVTNYRHLTQPELKEEINTIIKQDFINQTVQGKKGLTLNDV